MSNETPGNQNIQIQLDEKMRGLIDAAQVDIAAAKTASDLYEVKVKYTGKQGLFSALMRELAHLPKEDRPAFGQKVNQVKAQFEEIYLQRENHLRDSELQRRVESERIDLTLPGPPWTVGSRHPLSLVIGEIIAIMARLGYSVRTGPWIEHDRYNFEALNIPENHPARDLQDTFYVDAEYVLRTHTSPIQIHTLESEQPPLRILAPGGVFRCDSDISHSPHFHQIEGMLVDRRVSMADLKGTIAYFVREFFGSSVRTRFRPSYFPFTEPSAEVDCSCPICQGKGCRMCKNSGWVEIGGSGLINPRVLHYCGLAPDEWQGFAFGFGIERMAIIKYGIEDIRLFTENDLRFLGQFPG